MNTDNRVHFLRVIPDVMLGKVPAMKAICDAGFTWVRGTDIYAKVTCQECQKVLKEEGK